MDEYRCEWSTLLTAGALEEVLRLGILLLLGIGTDFEAVYSLGLGWSGIETMYYIGQSLFYAWWFSDDDYRAVASVAITETITPPSTAAAVITSDNGNDSGIESSVKNVEDNVGDEVVSTKEARHLLGIDRPWWSLMGRTSTALVHGSLYVIWGVLMPDHWSVPATSYGTMMAAMGVFLIGLALYGEII
ncbi:hypothetical protein BGZ65_012937 [Modicella reniformis]|uniref:Uncharacterized protein n=1 Tax=Modicella reniformis TaxID=1440133 RepID=A0A9P6MLN8_9FUNG|nr:hypothetical protein BGZ65_012937 [Modicella reniformis]